MLDLAPALSPTIAPLTPVCGGEVARAAAKLASLGFRAAQLSAAQRSLRPRELDHRARRDVAAMLGRAGLMSSGLDLFVPNDHWLDSAQVDRAAAAAVAAIELAADLGRIPVSINLPLDALAADVLSALLAAADARSVTLAVHCEHDPDALLATLQAQDQPILGAAIDPAAALALGHDPADLAIRLADRLRVARLDDYTPPSVASAGGRVPVGAGQLDVTSYRAALAVCPKLRAIVVELRELADPLAALDAASRAWTRSGGVVT